jgi:ankyrin repeat protein
MKSVCEPDPFGMHIRRRFSMKMGCLRLGTVMAALVTLIGCGSSVETTGGESIYLMAANGRVSEVRAALNGGFNVNTPDQDGRTLLHYAVAGNQASMAEILLVTYAADARIPDATGATATDLALQGGIPEILSVFQNEGLL